MPLRNCCRGPLLALILSPLAAIVAPDGPLPTPPDQHWQPLFQQVQGTHLFPDQKTFADAVPKRDPAALVAD